MELMPGYKQTEVGVIPEDWETPILESITEANRPISYGIVQTGPSVTGGIRCLRVLDIDEGKINKANLIMTSERISASYKRTVLKAGDLVMPLRGKVGDVGIIDRDLVGCNLTRGLALIAISPQWSSRYCKQAISYGGSRSRLEQSMNGTALQEIPIATLRSFKLPLPPTKAEQEAIAEALSDADALVESLEQLIAKKRHLKQGAMQELLTGKRRLPGFNREWVVKTIGEVASLCSEKNVAKEPLPVLTCSKHLGFVDSLGYFKNQVFSRDTSGYKIIRRGQIGYPSNHVEEGSIGLQDLYDVALVSPIYVVFSVQQGVDSYFLHRLLKLETYRQKFETATNSSVDRRGSLRWPAFSDIIVALPPLQEQIAIATILSDMDAEITALEEKLTKARQVKQAMMQELLTGRIRLI